MGASLLAIAVCQSTSMLDVPASSRASSLPQVLRLLWIGGGGHFWEVRTPIRLGLGLTIIVFSRLSCS
ncbi:hypothetical protein EAH72_21770 [Pseudomonas caspiana]|uniref:Uncharacterized protein n=1 Tax=Pseudomonas mandelii TaxID=75612 RepID=A0A502IDL2_9PSED|nr:hypothetical protein EAH74_14420 [Pseudomonas mandelii]TPG93130.1 hypothetical protein EAH72_21770 [Pseudomonas caspiana]